MINENKILPRRQFFSFPPPNQSGVAITIAQKALFKATLGSDYEVDQKDCDSMLGTPVYDSFTFGNLTDENSNVYLDILGETHTYKPIRLQDVLIEVNQTKVINQTVVQGRNGTVKQYICDGDYEILMSGYLSGKYDPNNHIWKMNGNIMPIDAMERLTSICKIGNTLNVTSALLSIFGVDQIVIQGFNFPQRGGQGNRYYFEIQMLSDNDFILEFEQEDVENSDKLRTILGV